MENGAKNKIVERKAAIKMAGRWPPDLSSLAGAGFDSISISKKSAILRKAASTDMRGNPHLFIEIELRPDSIALRHSCPPGCDESLRELQSAVFLMRVLRLAKGIEADAQSLSAILLPAVEKSEKMADEAYERLSANLSTAKEELARALAKNRLLMQKCEQGARREIELEQRAAALRVRLAKLESLPDAALRELLLEWLSSHRGAFSAAQFSLAHSIPPSRCEEGLAALLEEGAIQREARGFSVQKSCAREFIVRNASNPLQKFADFFRARKK